MREIGSEFSSVVLGESDNLKLPNHVCDEAFTFSGRTAIETILKNEPQIKKAMLPSYCCDSMLEPFRQREVELCFYDVNYDHGLTIDLQLQDDIDAILWCNYFGFEVSMPDLDDFRSHGGIIIEDITHSFLSQKKYHTRSHYLVASLRKWGPLLCGGYCASTKGELKYKPIHMPSNDFLTSKKKAMDEKTAFLSGDTHVCKDDFLQAFSSCNHWLAANYAGLSIDDLSLKILVQSDWNYAYEVRRNNAAVLYDGLQQIESIHFLFNREQMNCPLFVPIVLEQSTRDLVRRRLIENQIYCPIHWPKPNADCRSNLYDMELSLICDQRYDTEDMKRIVSVILDCISSNE